MESFEVVANQLFAFFLMLLVGYMATKTHVLSEAFLNELPKLIMRVLLPIMLFSNAANGTSRALLLEDWPILLLMIGMNCLLFPLVWGLSKMMGLDSNKQGVYQACFSFGNLGFIGLPILVSLFPGHGGIYIVLIGIVDQLLVWTYCLYLITPKDRDTVFSWRYFINPAVGAVLSSVILLLLDFTVPPIIQKPLLAIGWSATPLSLIYLGGLVYYSNWKIVLRTKELYWGILIKMIIFPILIFYLCSAVYHDDQMAKTIGIVAGMPTLVIAAMFSVAQKNYGEYALGMVLVTTVASLITLGVVSAIIL